MTSSAPLSASETPAILYAFGINNSYGAPEPDFAALYHRGHVSIGICLYRLPVDDGAQPVPLFRRSGSHWVRDPGFAELTATEAFLTKTVAERVADVRDRLSICAAELPEIDPIGRLARDTLATIERLAPDAGVEAIPA